MMWTQPRKATPGGTERGRGLGGPPAKQAPQAERSEAEERSEPRGPETAGAFEMLLSMMR